MKRHFLLLVAYFTAATLPVAAVPVVVDSLASGSFNAHTHTFVGFTANAFLGYQGEGKLLIDWGAPSVTGTFDIRLNNVWTTIWTGIVGPSQIIELEDIAVPILFATGIVDGLRLTSAPVDVGAHHSFNFSGFVGNHHNADTFTFDTLPTNGVPDAGTTLPLLGLALFVLFTARKSAMR